MTPEPSADSTDATPCPRCAGDGECLPMMQFLEELFEFIPDGTGCIEYFCPRCDHTWSDTRLPVWWPPVPVDDLDPFALDAAMRELERRATRAAQVADTLLDDGFDHAGHVSRDHRDWLSERFGVDDAAHDIALDRLVVPMSGVLLAAVLVTAAAVARSVDDLLAAGPDARSAAGDGLAAAVESYRRAAADFACHGFTDFSRPAEPDNEEEDEEDEPDPDGEFAAALRSGPGGDHPAVPDTWDDHLAATAAELFTDGSALSWARYVWAVLAGSEVTKVETEVDLVRARLRLAALDVLRSVFLERALNDTDEPYWRVEESALVGGPPLIDPFFLGVAAAAADVDPDIEIDWEFDEGSPQQYALTALVRAECATMAAELHSALGTSVVLATMWASSVDGAHYPLNRDALDVLLDHDLTWATHRVFAWIDEGMQV